jgi:nucleoid DNA-binding protein
MDHKKLVEDIAIKKNLTPTEVERAVRSQSSFTKAVMRRGKAEAVRWPYWGVFRVSKKRLKKVKENSGGQGLRQLEE